jgi:hypothetical protein
MKNQPTDAQMQEVWAMSDVIVAAMKKEKPKQPIEVCLSALGEVMLDMCYCIGLTKIGFVDVCRQLIDQYEDFTNGTDPRTAG